MIETRLDEAVLAKRLLEDRAKRIEQERERAREVRARASKAEEDFDPYQVAKWQVVAGPVLAAPMLGPMRKGTNGFWIGCKGCGRKFESLGMGYCETCLALPADERHALRPQGRACEAPSCTNIIAPTARIDAKYCSKACEQKARRARRPYENEDRLPDSLPPENVGSSEEKTQQNQWPENEVQKTEPIVPPRGPLSFDPEQESDVPGIPEFLRRR